MHDPEKFQAETIKAISDLHEVFASNQNRYLALSAVLKAAMLQMTAPVLRQIRENYLVEVNAQAEQLAPEHQRRQHWDDWEGVLDELVAHASQRDAQRPS